MIQCTEEIEQNRFLNSPSYKGVEKLHKFYEKLRQDPMSSEILTLCCLTGGPKRGQMQAYFWTDVHDNLRQRLYVLGEGSESFGQTARLRVDLLDCNLMRLLDYDPMSVPVFKQRNIEKDGCVAPDTAHCGRRSKGSLQTLFSFPRRSQRYEKATIHRISPTSCHVLMP